MPPTNNLMTESVMWKSLALKSTNKQPSNYLFPSLKTIAEEKLFIKQNQSGTLNIVGAGMILFHLDPTSKNIEILIVKEKSKTAKWGFPKGKTQYQCPDCLEKNCPAHRSCSDCSRTEFLCSHHWRCRKCQNLKKIPFCHKHIEPDQAITVAETRWECAVREVRQEIGINYQEEDHLIFDWLKIGRNYYFMVLTAKHLTHPQTEEISQIKWINLDELASKAEEQPNNYNMGIRRLTNKISHKISHKIAQKISPNIAPKIAHKIAL